MLSFFQVFNVSVETPFFEKKLTIFSGSTLFIFVRLAVVCLCGSCSVFLFEDFLDGSMLDEVTATVCEASGSLRDDADAPPREGLDFLFAGLYESVVNVGDSVTSGLNASEADLLFGDSDRGTFVRIFVSFFGFVSGCFRFEGDVLLNAAAVSVGSRESSHSFFISWDKSILPPK